MVSALTLQLDITGLILNFSLWSLDDLECKIPNNYDVTALEIILKNTLQGLKVFRILCSLRSSYDLNCILLSQ